MHIRNQYSAAGAILATAAGLLALAGCGGTAAAAHPAPTVTVTVKPSASSVGKSCTTKAGYYAAGLPGHLMQGLCVPDNAAAPAEQPTSQPAQTYAPPPLSETCTVGYSTGNNTFTTRQFYNAGSYPSPAANHNPSSGRPVGYPAYKVQFTNNTASPIDISSFSVALFDGSGSQIGSDTVTGTPNSTYEAISPYYVTSGAYVYWVENENLGLPANVKTCTVVAP